MTATPAKSQIIFTLPPFLSGVCDRAHYVRWLQRKATAHARRDRKRFDPTQCAIASYKAMIHAAVLAGGDRDYYTGLPLDWTLISKFDNDEAKAGKSKYLRQFGSLPTVDHVHNTDGKLHFVICSWRVNDAKSHLSEDEFCDLCEQILRHRRSKSAKKNRVPLSDAELLSYSGEHLSYELNMFYVAGLALLQGHIHEGPNRNIVIESFTIHLRNLIDFFYPERIPRDDVIAEDFISTGHLPPFSEKLKVARIRAHKEISHLTTKRIHGGPPEKNWDVLDLLKEITTVTQSFVGVASRTRLADCVRNLLSEGKELPE